MNIYYSLGFYIDPKTGRGAGSFNKIKCLSSVCDEFLFSSYLLKSNRGYFLTKFLNMVLQWLRDLYVHLGRHLDVAIIRDNIFFPLWLARLRGVLICSEVHAVPWEEIGESRLKRTLAGIYRRRYLAILKNSDTVIFNNPSLKHYYQTVEDIQTVSFVSYNGGVFSRSSKPEKADDSSQCIKFVYAGNIYPWHGVELLLPVVTSLSNDVDLEFYLVGNTDSYYARQVQALFDGLSVCTVIRQSNKDVIMQHIRAADYCFLPTMDTRSSPGNPIKLFDYLSEGKRVITQENCPGYSDVVGSVEAGICVNLHDPENAVRKILSTGLKRSSPEIEQRIIETSRDLHSWERRMTEWIELFKTEKRKDKDENNL